MALVTAAAFAVVFRAGHDQLEVDAGANGIGQGFPEAGPAGAAVVLGLGAEQREVAAGAVEDPSALFVVQRAGERPLSALLPQHLVGLGGKPLLPLGVTELPLGIAGLGGRLR